MNLNYVDQVPKNSVGILTGVALYLGRMDIFMMLRLPIQEPELSLHLFSSSSAIVSWVSQLLHYSLVHILTGSIPWKLRGISSYCFLPILDVFFKKLVAWMGAWIFWLLFWYFYQCAEILLTVCHVILLNFLGRWSYHLKIIFFSFILLLFILHSLFVHLRQWPVPPETC